MTKEQKRFLKNKARHTIAYFSNPTTKAGSHTFVCVCGKHPLCNCGRP